MTNATRETLKATAIRLGLKGHIKCNLIEYGARAIYVVNGQYYGVWDFEKQTWVD